MFKLIMILFFAMYLNANSDFKMKYFIDVHGEFKGILSIDSSKGKQTEVKYYNITSRDKIPFYAEKKSFSMTSSNSFSTLSTLNVAEFKKKMKYDLSSLDPDEIDLAGIAANDVTNSVIIYNKENLPADITQRRAIHTIESLLLSMYNKKAIPKDEFYLFEPHKNMLLKVKFSKEGSADLKFDGKVCNVDKWVLSLVGRNKRLVRVYVNPYPLKLESYSKKFAFTLAGVGKPESLVLMKKEIAFNAFKYKILNSYANENPKILSQSIYRNKAEFRTEYKTKFTASKSISDDRIEESLPSYLRRAKKVKLGANKNDSFVFAVDMGDIRDVLKDKLDLEDEDYYWKSKLHRIKYKSLLKIAAKKQKCKVDFKENGLLCKDSDGKYTDEQSIDFKEELEAYLSKTIKDEYKLDDISKSKNNNGLRYKVLYLTKISNNIKEIAIKDAFKINHKKFKLSSLPYKFDRAEKEYVININKKDVSNYACSDFIKGIKSEFDNNGQCVGTGIRINTEKEADKIIQLYLDRKYKDLKIIGVNIKNEKDKVSFIYLKNLKEVKNECK